MNHLAVTVASYSDAAGVNKGVWLRLVDNPPQVAWSRSVFNGLAQILVQSAKEAGTIKLTAKAESLTPATVELTTKAAVFRATLP